MNSQVATVLEVVQQPLEEEPLQAVEEEDHAARVEWARRDPLELLDPMATLVPMDSPEDLDRRELRRLLVVDTPLHQSSASTAPLDLRDLLEALDLLAHREEMEHPERARLDHSLDLPDPLDLLDPQETLVLPVLPEALVQMDKSLMFLVLLDLPARLVPLDLPVLLEPLVLEDRLSPALLDLPEIPDRMEPLAMLAATALTASLVELDPVADVTTALLPEQLPAIRASKRLEIINCIYLIETQNSQLIHFISVRSNELHHLELVDVASVVLL